MRVEKMLYEYPEISQNVQKLNLELNQIIQTKENAQDTLKANAMIEAICKTDPTDPTLKAVEKVMDTYERQITRLVERINDLIEIKDEIDKALRILSIEEYRIIELRFFNRVKWRSIPEVMEYSLRQCQRYQQTALEKLETEICCKHESRRTMA